MAAGPADTGRTYLCIDLKTFYASVECAARGLDPFTTNLVVADPQRGPKTICLAVTPAMKALGVRNRCRVFEIPERISYIKAQPRMRLYMEVSARIYGIYLRRFSPEDIHVYSIDECFIDLTPYLGLYGKSATQLALELMGDVAREEHICATAGIGTNLFLAKVALDVTAKHADDNIGFLDGAAFARLIAHHRPITDIWGIGPGIARRLAHYGVRDLAGVAAMDERLLYAEFGVNAEYLVDHARGIEPCTIADIHAYRPRAHSLCNGQVLACDYTFEEGLVVMDEMVDASTLDLVERGLACDQISLYVGYAREGDQEEPRASGTTWDGTETARALAALSRELGDAGRGEVFRGEHGTRVLGSRPPAAGASRRLGEQTCSRSRLMARFDALWREVVDPARPIRRVNIGMGGLVPAREAAPTLFDDVQASEREQRLARATLAVRHRYGKNALLRGRSLREKATARERNEQVGGHHA